MIDIDQALKDILSRKLNEPETPANLAESIRYSLLAPGKRIRPRLTLACAEMIGLPNEAALPAALALEMVHCFTLIHDDLPCMDDDDFRRGMPSNHKKFGEALALLAGDALMAIAVDTFTDISDRDIVGDIVRPEHFASALKRLNWAMGARGVIGGQAAEMLLTDKPALSDLEKMHAKKTGALFAAALLIPKDLAGLSDTSSQGSAIHLFAHELGLAFQVADDLDDAEQDSHQPTSILYYMPEAQARELFTRRLSLAKNGLQAAWGPKAQALIAISEQVAKSLGASK